MDTRGQVTPEGRGTAKSIAIYVGLGLGLVIETLSLHEFLAEAHRMYEPSTLLLLYMGAILALFWFGNYLVSVFVRGKPALEGESARKGRKVIFGLLALSCAIDAATTLRLQGLQEEAYGRAVAASGEGEIIATFAGMEQQAYRLRVQVGAEMQEFTLRRPIDGEFPEWASAEFATAIERAEGRFPVAMVQDLEWPARMWLAGMPWEDGGFIAFSKLLLLAQTIGLLGYSCLLFPGRMPAWAALDRVSPLACEVTVCYVLGFVRLSAMLLLPAGAAANW
jgi:hypothetical protein